MFQFRSIDSGGLVSIDGGEAGRGGGLLSSRLIMGWAQSVKLVFWGSFVAFYNKKRKMVIFQVFGAFESGMFH